MASLLATLGPPSIAGLTLGEIAASGAWGFGAIGGLFVANGVGLLALGAYRNGHRVLPLAALSLLLYGTLSQFILVVGGATGQFLAGNAEYRVVEPGNPDPRTRVQQGWVQRYCCLCDPRHDDWNNGTLTVLSKLLGSSPGSYHGPYPTRTEALALLRTLGERPTVDDHGQAHFADGRSYRLLPVPETYAGWWSPEAVLDLGLVPRDFADGGALRAVALSEAAMLVEEPERISLRLWFREGQRGEVWASWPRSPPTSGSR